MKRQESSPFGSSRRRESVNTVKYSREFSITKVCSSGEKTLSEPHSTQGRISLQLEPLLAFLFHHRGRGKGMKHLWRSQPKDTGPLKAKIQSKDYRVLSLFHTLKPHQQGYSIITVDCRWKSRKRQTSLRSSWGSPKTEEQFKLKTSRRKARRRKE